MINKLKLLKHIEKEFNIKAKAEELLYYVGFDWRNDLVLEIIEVYIGAIILKLNNNMISKFSEYMLVYSDSEIYLLSKLNERSV